jgi:hypothetical protein
LGEYERRFMKNKLSDLQNHLFEMIETLNDINLKGEKLDIEIKRALAVNELAKTAVANGALMAKCVDLLYGIPVSDEVPLIPKADGETFAEGVVLGRPVGRKSVRVKLTGREKEIETLRKANVSKSEIGRRFGVNRMTVDSFMRAKGIK